MKRVRRGASDNTHMPKNFCSAPWMTLNLNPNGNVTACCIYNDVYGNTKDGDFKQIMNNDHVKNLRKRFLNNERPKACERCWREESVSEQYGTPYTSLRTMMNGWFSDDYINNTQEDGHYEDIKLRYWDMRPNNTCNLGCLMCDVSLSTGNGRLMKEIGIDDWQNKWNSKTHIKKDTNWDKNFEYLSANIDNLDHAYFAGGEPTILPEHLQMLQLISKKSPDVFLRYNTNLTTLKYKGIDLLDIWKNHPGGVTIDASVDSSGLPGEIQRVGSNWSLVKENLVRINKEAPNIHITFNMVQTLLTVNNLENTILELEEIFGRDYLTKNNNLRFSPSYAPAWLDIRLLLKDMINYEQFDRIKSYGYDVSAIIALLDSYDEFSKDPDKINNTLYLLFEHRDKLKKHKNIDFENIIPNFDRIKFRASLDEWPRDMKNYKKVIPIWNDDGTISADSPNKTFCMAPWAHTYISPQGERRLCCASREEHSFQKQYIDATNDERYGEVKDSKTDVDDFRPKSLEEHWNSQYMKDIRVKLMSGERIPQCDVCNDDILSISSYRKWFTGVLFKDKIQEAFDKTNLMGETTMPTISFDYRYSNLCNFKCRMCGEQLSSSWEAEKKKHDLWSPKNQPFMKPDVKKKMNEFQVNVVEPEFKKAISDGIVEEIYWVGGEPLMYDIHWWALEEMVQNGSAKNCYLRYNSNLSRIEFKGKNLYDYLPQFKDWMMCASIDGTGEIVEFIRKGIVWEDWLSNFKQGLELPNGKNKMILDLTITGPGMFSLKDMFDLSRELDVRLETKIMFAFHNDIVMSPFAWPRHILDRKIDELLAYMEPNAGHKQMTLINTLREMRNRPTFAEQWPEEHEQGFKNGFGFQKILDRIRQEPLRIEDIYKEDQELYDWWKRYDRQ